MCVSSLIAITPMNETNEVLSFLKDLKANNNREWFAANKPRYDHARAIHVKWMEEALGAIAQNDPLMKIPALKDCIFRIFRDVRFSADKSPYKTNFGAFVAPGGRKSEFPGYYFHLEPGECFVAGGVYMPGPDNLKLLRDEVYFHSSEFKAILAKPSFAKLFGPLGDWDKMKKPPSGYPADFADIDLLKYRSYIVSAPLSDEQITTGDPKMTIGHIIKELQSFMAFLRRAYSQV